MAIPKEVIEDIKSRAKIEDVIESYIPIIKQGANYIVYCPFHEDHDPSLHINTSKQIFKCFSCPSENKSSGDVFSFVMKYKKISYPEAIKEVANKIGYDYDFDKGYKKEFEETIYHKIIKETVAFCQNELNTSTGAKHKDYLINRGLTKELLLKYQIGYNPSGNRLYQFLKAKGYSDNDIIEANVCRLTQDGIKDVFYDRIIIPICDVSGNPIGFTARTIDKNNPSKYINSTDTPIFHKSSVLFNLSNSKAVIKKGKMAILAEGVMDVLAFERAGISNAICSLGTNLTQRQLMLLSYYCNKILLSYDGDKVGQSAILRAGQMAKKAGFEVVVFNNNTSLDPDEIINEYGSERLNQMISKPLHWIEFLMIYYQDKYDLTDYNQKKEYVNLLCENIKECKDVLDKDEYAKRLSDLTGFSYEVLEKKVGLKTLGDEPSPTNKTLRDEPSPEKKNIRDEPSPKAKATKKESFNVLAGIVDSIRNVKVNDEARTVVTVSNGRWKYSIWSNNKEYVDKMKLEEGKEIVAVISNYSKQRHSANLLYFNYPNTLFSVAGEDGRETNYLLAKSYNPKQLSEKLNVSSVLVKKWNNETKQVEKLWIQLKFTKDNKELAFQNEDFYLYKLGEVVESQYKDKTYYSCFVKDAKRIYDIKKNEVNLTEEISNSL